MDTKENPLVSPKHNRTPGWNRVMMARTCWVTSGGMLMVAPDNGCRLGERRAMGSKGVTYLIPGTSQDLGLEPA